MYDIVIIGSGPAGLSAAIYAKREMLNAVVIEKEYLGTGQIALSERVDNYPGFYGESGYDLGDKFLSHAQELGAEIVQGEIERIERCDKIYTVHFSDGKSFDTKTIIYAAGAKPRKLNVPGESEFIGGGVSYCAVCDGAFYKNKIVAVVGGGDTALQDALLLSKIADKVYLIHRREEFRANKILQEKVRTADNIELILNAVSVEISGENKVASLRVLQNGAERLIDVNGVFIAIGSVPNTSLLDTVAELDSNGYIVADEDGVTSAEGIFAAGDVRTKKLRQVVTAVSDGANCVISAEEYILNNGL